MSRELRLFLEDIQESIERIEEYTGGLTESEFTKRLETQDAVIRRLEIIGEAVKHLPEEIKDQNPKIPWSQIAGMRNLVADEYFEVKTERIWETIQNDLPSLKRVVRQLLDQEV